MRILLAGATGTVGRAVCQALLAEGHSVVALVRPNAKPLGISHSALTIYAGQWSAFSNSVDATVPADTPHSPEPFDALISCIASRSGAASDAERVDYQANCELLAVAKRLGIHRFLLLSAICVQKPRLAFQRAKLRFEQELARSGLDYSIIRPTAFFKSLSGQLDRVRSGKPFLVFGDGLATACKPISERDLAVFMLRCVNDPASFRQILPIGGPGPALTPIDQAECLSELLGRPVAIRSISPTFFNVLSAMLLPMAPLSQWIRDKREFLRIGHYYATESMLVWDERRGRYDADATPETGNDRLIDHYRSIIAGEQPLERIEGATLF